MEILILQEISRVSFCGEKYVNNNEYNYIKLIKWNIINKKMYIIIIIGYNAIKLKRLFTVKFFSYHFIKKMKR